MTVLLQKNADGSVVLPLSPDMVAHLNMQHSAEVVVSVEGRGLSVQPAPAPRRRRYKLSELLADYDQIPKDAAEEFEWLSSPPVGQELL